MFLLITSFGSTEATHRREDWSLTHFRFPLQKTPTSRRPRSFNARKRPRKWNRRTTTVEVSLRNSLRFNFDVIVERMQRVPEAAAATDSTWTEWRFCTALRHEYVMKKEKGDNSRIDIWDTAHAHLAALYVAEKGKSADPRKFHDLTREQQREQWLKILRFAKQIRGSGRRKSATTKLFHLLRKEFGIRGGTMRWKMPPMRDVSRREQAKRVVAAAISTVPKECVEMRRFMKGSIRLSEARAPTIGDVRTNCRVVAREGSFAELAAVPKPVMESLVRGEDTEVRTENWNVEYHPSAGFVSRMWDERADEWKQHFGPGAALEAAKAQMEKEQLTERIRGPTPEYEDHLP